MKQIQEYPNYAVTADGRIISTGRVAGRSGKGFSEKEKELVIMHNQNGYCLVNLTKDRSSKTKYVHRLVAEAFLDNPNNLPQVNHIDGNKDNNHFSNLEWCTALHNNQHALDLGLREGKKGETNSQAKITEGDAISIISLILEGLSNIEIADKFKLHDRYISLIRGKKRWKHIWERDFSYVGNPPISCRIRTKAFNAQRLSKALQEKEASRVDSSESKREDS